MAGPREQPLPPDVIGRDDATEVLRAFVIDGGSSNARNTSVASSRPMTSGGIGCSLGPAMTYL